jgi:acetoin utilization protein AcuB
MEASMSNRSIAAYMTKNPYSIGADQSLTQAHELMRARRVRHVPVLSAGKLVGLVSQRDLSLIEALSDVDPATVPVEDAMSQLPYVVSEDADLEGVVSVMAEKKYGSAVVVRGERVVGVFTTTDALRALSELLHSDRTTKRPGRAA